MKREVVTLRHEGLAGVVATVTLTADGADFEVAVEAPAPERVGGGLPIAEAYSDLFARIASEMRDHERKILARSERLTIKGER